ncbi:hypothetical protein M0813_16254 [Anaeramoeba flamelloides]|uniref:RRM domain-containing protein n=1 Tax=Anaeramoeba flamelloides TaxID=1746091 RepID=A0ABQ8Z0J2_9EUKA|nr:hypothetical protein M0813_16254 [Anaeramoeba flamelloides]
MYRSTTKKLFISNLPKEYSVDLLLRTISNWTEDVPNLQIISNKKNPDNGLAILCSVSQEQSIILKQKLPKKQFQGRFLKVADFVPKRKRENNFRNKAKIQNNKEKEERSNYQKKKKDHSQKNSNFNYVSKQTETQNQNCSKNEFFDHDHGTQKKFSNDKKKKKKKKIMMEKRRKINN